MNDYSYKKLIVWQKAKEFIVKIYKITETYPKTEIFVLTSQMRRAALSIAANIAEGNSKRSKKDFLNYLNIAEGSLAEVDSFLEISFELKYLTIHEFRKLIELRKEIGFLLHQLIIKLSA